MATHSPTIYAPGRSQSSVATRGSVQPVASALTRTLFFHVLALTICACAWALRLFWIGHQSLWYDEALSASLATEPYRSLVDQLSRDDVHPPLYFLLLHGWIHGAGTSELALRSLSAWSSTLAVPLLMALGTRIAGRRVGIVTGVLACCSPLLIYYGQETRMYALLACLSTLSGYAFIRASRGPRRWWYIYLGAMEGVFWTHLAGTFLFAALNVWWLVSFIVQQRTHRASDMKRSSGGSLMSRRDVFRPWLFAQVGVVLLFIPWLLIAGRRLASYSSPVHGGPIVWMLEQTAIVFSLGHTVVGLDVAPQDPSFAAQDAVARWLLIPFLCAFAAGLVALRGQRLLVATWLLIPIGGITTLATLHHGFDARYLIEATPIFFVALAAGLVWCWRHTKPGALILTMTLLTISTFSLSRMYTDPAYARDDNRQVVQFLATHARPDSAVILDAGFTPAFQYYAQGTWPTVNLPATVPVDPIATERSLTAFTSGRSQVWLVLWHDYYADPNRLVWTWLLQHNYAADWVNVNDDFKVLRFDRLPDTGLRASGAVFGDALQLVGSTTSVTQGANNESELTLDLYWKSLTNITTNYSLVTHVLDSAGSIYGRDDAQPAGGHLPTSSWHAGDHFHTVVHLPLLPWTAPGDYRIQVQVYNPTTGELLRVGPSGSANTSEFMPVTLTYPTRQQAAVSFAALPTHAHPLDARFGALATLAGCQESVNGTNTTLTLFWHSMSPSTTNLKVFVHALDARGQVVATGDSEPVMGAAPTSHWFTGETVRDPHMIRNDRPITTYEVGLYDQVTGERITVQAGADTRVQDQAVYIPVGH